ncbi:MAG: DEAD/DEAH box helicase family protein [Prolixibacteraceae bacterium]|nr:DEAD/DEAH box helicase family protein [Prolixibacteraceae bacterium]
MNQIANNIKQRLSLREPLCEALDTVVRITDCLSLKKQKNDAGLDIYLKEELFKVKEIYPTCTNFERDFPSLAFSIATGIGKTRLMAACIIYLYLKKGIRHFFVLAPNLTLYEKLIRDFSDTSYSKYVFRGVAELVHNQPVVITGDNYEQVRGLFSDTDIQINVFNIAKFNSDTKESKKGTPRIKRLSEYLGQSYFDFLSNLDDLVILMDEAHRYHADASKKAINELCPVLGLEMTATPFDEKGKAFKNIVYEYNLAQALQDGKYVKNPTVAKRKNFEKGSLTDKELDILKLEDAVSIHENAKLHLELYARDNDMPLVKPFILVVCRNILHATETIEMLENEMFDGRYRGKVLQIDSSTKKDEEVDGLFVSLEDPDNKIEIVVHVNMLKEGWDVTNLYTIVPLRAADAPILVEQSIGRGLRLPYGGKRTGNSEVDKLTVIAHENFEAVLAKAKDPNSILNKFSFVELDDEYKTEPSKVVTAKSIIEQKIEKEQEKIARIENEYEQKQAQTTLDAKRAVWQVLPTMNALVKNKKELSSPQNIEQIKTKTIEIIIQSAAASGSLFAQQEALEQIKEVNSIVDAVTVDYVNNIIEIPRMTIQQQDLLATFSWFDLQTSEGFTLPALKQEIIRMGLVTGEVETILAESSGAYGDPVRKIVVRLMNYEEISYDDNSGLLYHLAEQACDAIKSNLVNKEELSQIVGQFKDIIAERIFRQMKDHFSLSSAGYIKPAVLPFVEIISPNLTEVSSYGYRDYRDIITPSSLVKKYIFRGFLKSYHLECKFDSSTEQDFAFILESDTEVIRWLRPAPNQFRIYWANNSKRYEPDFIVETGDLIYMVETKRADEVEKEEVLAKKKAAEEYCRNATEYTSENGGKPWKYVIIGHDSVSRTSSFEYILAKS